MSDSTAFPLPSVELRQATAAALAGQDVITALPLRVLAVTGSDALTFLQGQVTTDMREVSSGESRLGCLLNLKGRIQVSFRTVAVSDGFLLILPADQMAATQARLGKYAVFSKVVLSEREIAVRGVLGSQARARLQAEGWRWPEAAQLVSRHHDDSAPDDALLIRLPGQDRALLLGGAPEAANAAVAVAAWHSAVVAAGELLLPAAASERYQPQELDYHQLHGVSYQKGCYLGQEIVARLYFRGQLKTALMRLSAAWPADAGDPALKLGQDIFSGERSVGEVISVTWPDDERVELLALVRQDATELSLDIAGVALALTPLPFSR